MTKVILLSISTWLASHVGLQAKDLTSKLAGRGGGGGTLRKALQPPTDK